MPLTDELEALASRRYALEQRLQIEHNFNLDKPYFGLIREWSREGDGGGYEIVSGIAEHHPDFLHRRVTTSKVLRLVQPFTCGDLEIETINSRYTLDINTYRGARAHLHATDKRPIVFDNPKSLTAERIDSLAHVRDDLKGPEAPEGHVHVPGYGFVPESGVKRALELSYAEAKKIVELYETDHRRANEPALTKSIRNFEDLDSLETKLRHPGNGSLMRLAIEAMTRISHGISVTRGWHDKPVEPGTRIALMHSELSEMLEGVRKDTMDDHVPTRKTEEVEAADLLIRLLDHCGYHNLDLWGAYYDKSLYNITRKDHDPVNRQKEGGKKF